MLKIMHVVAGLDIGRIFGGAENNGVQLAMAMARAGHAVTLGVFWRFDNAIEQDWLARLHATGVQTEFATGSPPTRALSDVRSGIARLTQLADAFDAQIVHAHHEGGTLAALAAKRRDARRRALRTAYVPLKREWGAGPGATALRLLFSQLLFPARLDAEIGVSPQFAQDLSQRWVSRRAQRPARMIYNAGDWARFAQSARTGASAQRPAVHNPLIVCVARLTEQKGQRYLLQALATIIRAMPMARCILVGDGEDRAALEQQAAQLGLTQAVTFAGHADEAAVKQHLETATLFALPSLWEGVPLALLEAIASGLPVICTDIPGNRELIHDGISGWLVPARHPQALATAILDAASDPAGAQQRAQAARASLHRFDIDQLAGQHVDLYAELLHKRP